MHSNVPDSLHTTKRTKEERLSNNYFGGRVKWIGRGSTGKALAVAFFGRSCRGLDLTRVRCGVGLDCLRLERIGAEGIGLEGVGPERSGADQNGLDWREGLEGIGAEQN